MKRSWYATPYALWMLMFTIVPLLFVCYYAFTTPEGAFTFDNIAKIFTYSPVLLDSLRLAFYCTVLCLLIGYPAAWFMASKDLSKNQSLSVLILVPMWMNFLLRTYAMMTLFENNGVLNMIFEWLGLPKQRMIGTEGAVLAGMVYNYLPFMILPIYSVIVKLDGSLLEAARDLGASSAAVFRRVIFPLSLPGILSGVTMVFVPSVSTFAISRLLGGGTQMMLGDLIEQQFLGGAYNPHLGAAISMVMMVIVVVCMVVMNHFGEGEEQAVML